MPRAAVLGVLIAGGIVSSGMAAAAESPADDPGAATAAALDVTGPFADVLVVDLPATAGAARIHCATLVRAPPGTIQAMLLDPAHYRALIPSLIRSDVEPGSPPGVVRVAWELEVPLVNLSGHHTLRAIPDGVEMVLYEGDLPGRVVFHTYSRADGFTALEVDAQIDVRRSSWFLRRVMARSPFGEPAALAAAAWVALRATALRAEHPRAPGAVRPGGQPAPPAAWLPDARALADPRLAALRARGALAVLGRQVNDRLAGVAVAVPVAGPASALATRLRDPASWRAFPGWKRVIPMPPAAPGVPPSALVEDSIPFVDLDARWQGQTGPGSRWIAVEGAARGARLGWDVFGEGAGAAVAVLTLYPRLEETGVIPRKFIKAEPLLEHGLSLSLTLVYALGATRAR
jgi:hypothetical protein